MQSLITGISGSGGSYLAEYIVENHPEVKIHGILRANTTSTNKNLKGIEDKVTLHQCDLIDQGAIYRVLKEVNPDYIFHLAADADVRKSFYNPSSVIGNNVMGTLNLLESIRNLEIKPLIQLCSTSEVYGQVDPKNVPIKEDCPIQPGNPYAISKVTQDFMGDIWFKSFDIPIIRTRMFGYVNPKRKTLFASSFAMQVAKIEQGLQKKLLHGNLDSTRTLLDVRDAMESYWVTIEKCEPGEVYNIGSSKPVKIGEFLDILKQKAKCEILSEVDPDLLRPVDVTLQIPDMTKFTEATGWKPKYSFEESVDYLLEYCRKEVENHG